MERKVPTVRQQFLSSYDFGDIREANEKVREWCLHGYGITGARYDKEKTS